MKTKTRNPVTFANKFVRAILAAGFAAILVACSGGGGGDPVATPTTPATCTAPAVLTNGACVTPSTPPAPTPINPTGCTSPAVLTNGVCVTPPTAVTCTPPQVLTNGVCVAPPVTPPVVTPPVTCTAPAVLTNGACVTPPTTPTVPVITVPPAQPQNVKVFISAANTLPAGCNFTYEACWANSVNNGTVLIINGGGQNYGYYKANGLYMVRAIGADGMLVYGSRAVDAYGVSANTDWVMGTSSNIVIHQATDNTCYDRNANQIACPV